MNCPKILIGDGAACTDEWPVLFTRHAKFHVELYIAGRFEFYSGEKLLATLENGELEIMTGYSCDGYSPVVWLPIVRKWLRLTPTPKCGFAPAALHDFTRQFFPVVGCPWTRIQTDNWFFNCLLAGKVHPALSGIYHQAVAGVVGTAYIRLTRKSDPKLRIVHIARIDLT